MMGLGLVAFQAPPGSPDLSVAPASDPVNDAVVPPAPTPAPTSAPSIASAEPPAPTPPSPSSAPPPVADDSSDPPDTRPVVRAGPGNWGMTFIFGGLSPISVAGLGDQQLADGVIFTEIGVRRVFKRVVVPFSIGAGMTSRQNAGDLKPTISAGVSASVAVLRGFRVWRRIAPYYGGFVHTHYVDAAGPDNWLVNVSIGPILGIEYYLGDRVSLYGQGIVGIGPDIRKSSVQWAARATLAAGGQLGPTFYF